MSVLKWINKQKDGNKTNLAVLIDPDKTSYQETLKLVRLAEELNIDLILVGGSTVDKQVMDDTLQTITEFCNIPTIIFPGHYTQVNDKANALLLLSLISGDNPEYLIGQHIKAAPILKKSNLEIIPTGYVLVDGGADSSVSRVSQTRPICQDQIQKCVNIALAGQYLGMQLLYLEAGSGASITVSNEIISAVKAEINIPLIVGGGIKTVQQAIDIKEAGADIIVVGNALEKDPHFLKELKHHLDMPKTATL